MFSTTRERFLVRILVATGFAVIAYWLIDTRLLKRWRELANRIDQARSQLADKEQEGLKMTFAIAKHRDEALFALPPDAATAATKYYGWLYQKAESSAFEELKIDPTHSRNDTSLGSLLGFQVSARTTLTSLAGFLETIDNINVAHQLTSLQIFDYSPLTEQVRVSLSIETISSPLGPEEWHDPSEPDIAHDPTAPTFAEVLASRRPWNRYEPPRIMPKQFASKAVTAPETPPPVDLLSKVRLIGITQRNGDRLAWFFDCENRREILVGLHDPVSVADFDSQVAAISDDGVELTSNRERLAVRLGKTLRETLTP